MRSYPERPQQCGRRLTRMAGLAEHGMQTLFDEVPEDDVHDRPRAVRLGVLCSAYCHTTPPRGHAPPRGCPGRTTLRPAASTIAARALRTDRGIRLRYFGVNS